MCYKIVQDSVHGSIKFDGVLLELLDTPEIQRLNGIKQLALSYLTFPGANHTRLEHSMGVSYIAGLIGKQIDISKEDIEIIKVVGLLHDLGHSPFSHTLEPLLYQKTGKNHMEITTDIISNERRNMHTSDSHTIKDILEKEGFDIPTIKKIITGEIKQDFDILNQDENQKYFGDSKNYLIQIINGNMDADQLDYLMRDSHYTGASHGIIDYHRIFNTMTLKNGELVFDKRGISALEGFLVARSLMYSSVYFHKTVRIAEMMLSRAVESLNMENWLKLYEMNDAELLCSLMNGNTYTKDISSRIKYRRLFKKAFEIDAEKLNDEMKKKLSDISEKRKLEREIAERAGVQEGYVLIDVPLDDLHLSEPRLNKINLKVLEGERVHNITNFSPLAKALQIRQDMSEKIVVITTKENIEKVKKSSDMILLESI